jgi:hypothetical protein
MDTASLKTINYRGGVIRFRIPASWNEEYEKAGGGTFYAPGDKSGTLRLNVLTFQAPPDKPVDSSTARQVLALEAEKHGVEVTPLMHGVAMVRFDEPTEENGEALNIRYWQIAQVLPPVDIRLVIFSYTLLVSQLSSATSVAELAMLDREITAAELAPVLGVTPPPKTSWWRRS